MKNVIAKFVLVATLSFQASVGAVMSLPPATVATITGITVISTLPVTTGFVGCSKDQLLAAAKDVLTVVEDRQVQDALRTLSPAALAKLLSIVPTARNLVEAIRNGDTSSALALVNTIFPVIDEIADALNAKPQIKAVLALANIALHFIINHTQSTAPAIIAATPEAQRAIELGNKPVWGCNLRSDKRCAELAH
jgi:hypothetical protein